VEERAGIMNKRYEYECALSGLTVEGGMHFGGDSLEDLPARWTEVKFSRRLFNSKWVAIQQTKRAMVEGLLSQLPEEARRGQVVLVRLQVDAQFYQMEQDTPVYFTEVETVYLAPKELSGEVEDAYNEARGMLGLDALDEDEEDEEEEASEPEKKAEKAS
jgi:hypothetical protein